MKLITDRLVLRAIQKDDATAIFNYRSDALANKYQGWIPQNINDVNDFIDKVSKAINIPGTWFQFLIICSQNDEIIGDIGIHFLDAESKQVEIGCTLCKFHQKKGLATEALRRIITYLFEDLNKQKVIASIDPRNSASIELVTRLGFKKEAHFRENLFINNEWVDDAVYAILNEEWITSFKRD